MNINKQKIIELFEKNVKGRKANTSLSNQKHDGKEGHWLEKQMGVKANASNSPDILGYEMKKGTKSKTTFGDWSANYYIYKDDKFSITRDNFLEIFGKPNPKKGNRYSWSGEPCPNINGYNLFGQKLIKDEENNIIAHYNYLEDKREGKENIVPKKMQIENLVLAKWLASSLKEKLERKFNQNGWFICKKDKEGYYTNIHFGEPINFENWIEMVKDGTVFFDSGMYQGNSRNYSQWRANNSLWDSLITEVY